MRDQNQVNLSVLRHRIRRAMGTPIKWQPGVPAASLWQMIADIIVPTVDVLGITGGGGTSHVRVSTLDVLKLLKLGNDSSSSPTVAASLELQPVFFVIPGSGNDIALPEGSTIAVYDTGGATLLTSFVSDSRYGRTVFLINQSSVPRVFLHDDSATGTAGNRLYTPNAAPVVWEQGDVVMLHHVIASGGPTGAFWYVMPIKKGAQGASRYGARWVDYVDEEEISLVNVTRTHDTVGNLLHANSIIDSVVGRVNVLPGGTSTFDVGITGTATRFATGVSSAATTQFVGLNHKQGSVATDAAGPVQVAAAKVRLTVNTNTTNGLGLIRVVVFGRTFVAPSS